MAMIEIRDLDVTLERQELVDLHGGHPLAVVGAFVKGFNRGRRLDSAFGLSDKISDAASGINDVYLFPNARP